MEFIKKDRMTKVGGDSSIALESESVFVLSKIIQRQFF